MEVRKINEKKTKNYLPQILAAVAVTLSSASDGIHYGWTSPVLPKLKAADSAISISETDGEWLELLYMIGGLAGLPVIVSIVDKIGRKKTILFANSCSFLSWVLIATATRVELLFAARFVAGMAADVAFVAVPMYIGELVEKQIRGMLTSFINIMVLIGVVICYSVAPFVSVTHSAMVGASFVLAQLLILPFMPETPYFHLLKDRKDKAEKSLQWTRKRDDVQKELEDIQAAVKRQSAERGKFKDLFIVKSNRKALIIMTVLNAVQHFSSISVIMMNIHTILNDADGIIETNTACIIFASIMLISGLCGATVIDKFGRKALLISSSLAAAIALGSLSVYLTFKHHSYDVLPYNWVPIVAVFLYAAAFRLGLGLVPIVVTAEIFPTSVKAMGMTISDGMFVGFASITIYLYQILEHYVGMHVPFYIFTVSCILNIFFVVFVLPETKGKTLEQIQMMLKGEQIVQEKEKRSGVI